MAVSETYPQRSESVNSLAVYNCTHMIAGNNTLEVAGSVHIKYNNREIVFHTKCKRRHIHYTQVFTETFLKADVLVLRCSRIFFGIGCVNTCLLYTSDAADE